VIEEVATLEIAGPEPPPLAGVAPEFPEQPAKPRLAIVIIE
jgi:hypothetical protein